MTLTLSVYLRANVPNKVITCFAKTGQTEKIVLYSKKVGGLCWSVAARHEDKGTKFATQLVKDESGPLVDVKRVISIFMSQNMIQPATSLR